MAIATALLVGGPGHLSAHEALERAVDRRSRRAWWRRDRRSFAGRAVRLLK